MVNIASSLHDRAYPDDRYTSADEVALVVVTYSQISRPHQAQNM